MARIAATRLSDSFDDGLMRLHSLPFLEEAPPSELSLLTACLGLANPNPNPNPNPNNPNQAPPPELNFLTAGNAMATKVVAMGYL